MQNDEIILEIGYGLIPLFEKQKAENLFEEMKNLREKMPVIPVVRVMDNIELGTNEFCIEDPKNMYSKKYVYDFSEDFERTILNALLEYGKKMLKMNVNSFKTGEKLSVCVEIPSENTAGETYNINLMLPGYPTFWHTTSYYYPGNEATNCNYGYYITEIHEVSDGLFKVEIINTEVDEGNSRYFLGGRFKFYLKKGDEVQFQYYSGDEYIVKATVSDIKNNHISFDFEKDITIPEPLLKKELNRRGIWIY